MAVPKIVLFYVFTPLADPEAVRLWQSTLASSLNLTGRVIVSPHGINATLGGDVHDLKQYTKATRGYAPFAGADIKWSDGLGDDFPRLSVKVRPELVTFGHPDEVVVDESGVVGGGEHLSPSAVDRLVAGRGLATEGGDVVFFDGRNAMEAEIGRFRDAVVPATDTTRDFVAELESGKYDDLKNKAVVTYCTGGVRCEVLSVLMKNRGFDEVYQLDGGIVRYGEARGNDGLWDGSLYVFDKRMHQEFSDKAVSLGRCVGCGCPTPLYANCENASCRRMYLCCGDCSAADIGPTCGECVPVPR
jgi:UPF0176 protein